MPITPNVPLTDLKPELTRKFRTAMTAVVNVALSRSGSDFNRMEISKYERAEEDFIEFLDKFIQQSIRQAK